MIEDSDFYAWLDGELGPEETARIEAKIAADPQLQRLAARHRAMRERLRRAFQPVIEASLPERVAAAARPADNVVDLSAARERRRPSLWMQASAMAATLAVGIFTGAVLLRGESAISDRGGRIVASGDLADALTTGLASAPQREGVRIGLTFRDRQGAVCRSFSNRSATGLACRDGKDWRIRGLFAAADGANGDYRMAGAPDARLFDLISETIAGEPLDAEQEAELVRSSFSEQR